MKLFSCDTISVSIKFNLSIVHLYSILTIEFNSYIQHHYPIAAIEYVQCFIVAIQFNASKIEPLFNNPSTCNVVLLL
jgi:hypothetical protein